MIYIVNRWLYQPRYSQLSFFILLLLSILINGYIFEIDSNFYILYIFCAIFLGIGFFNHSYFLIVFLTVILVLCRYSFIPEQSHNWITFLTYLLTYLLITFISVGMMKHIQMVKEDQFELILTLAKALDTRDPYTLHHSENVARYAVEIAKKMKVSKELSNVIQIGGLLHDIGKIGIPETILNKPGALTEDEYSIVKTHPNIGYEIIKHVSSFHNSGVLDIVLYHHERFDGKGYPVGLKGNNIPLAARIVTVADTFDAMTSKRSYRNSIQLDSVLKEIQKNKGTQFDPQVVDAFLNLFDNE